MNGVLARFGPAFVAALVLAFPAPARAQAQNIVIVMADDLDVPTFEAAIAAGFLPNYVQHVLLPGTDFTRAFVVQSSCCPSRTTLLTGQYPHNHGVQGNYVPIGGCEALDDSSTLATWLKAAGYRTGIVGKYLNLYGDGLQGGTGCHDPRYVPPGWDDWQVLYEPSMYEVYNYDLTDNGTIVTYGSWPVDYQTDVLAARAVDFVTESEAVDAQPFFLLVTPVAPHLERRGVSPGCQTSFGTLGSIRAAPRHEGTAASIPLPRSASFNEADVGDKPAWIRNLAPMDAAGEACVESVFRDRLEALRAVDDLIGTIAAALQAAGEHTRTVLIFTSDNGFLLGDHRLTQKTHVYDASIRVPLTIRRPLSRAAAASDEVVTNVDLAPTLLEVAGVAPGLPPDGRSLGPLFRSPDAVWRRRFLVEHHQEMGMPDGPSFFAVRSTARSPFTPEHLFSDLYVVGDREHYDGVLDPDQLQSLHADTSPARVAERAELLRLQTALVPCAAGTCQGLEFRDPRDGITAGGGAADAVDNRFRLFDGTGALRAEVVAYAAGRWGVDVAAGGIDATGHAEALSAPGPGPTLGPQVRAFRTDRTPLPKVNFYAYGTLRYGARVASGGLDTDTPSEILTGAGAGAVFGPHVRGFEDAAAGAPPPIPAVSFYAFGTLRYGCRPDGTELDEDGFHEILTAPGPGPTFAPQVRGFDYDDDALRSMPGLGFVAFPVTGYGAEVAGVDLVAGGRTEILVAPGPGGSGSFPAELRAFAYEAPGVSLLPGGSAVVVPGSLYGARASGSDPDVDGREEALGAAGPDPSLATSVVALGYDGTALAPDGPAFDAFPGRTYGATVAGGYFGF